MTVLDFPLRQARPPRTPLTEAELLRLLEEQAAARAAAAMAQAASASPPGPQADEAGAPTLAAPRNSLARHMTARKLYLFTLPKSGTYFLAELMSRLGWYHSGIHLGEDHYLDTQAQDLAANASNPSAVRRLQPYAKTLAELPNGALCFGHMTPMYFHRPHLHEVAVVACRRRPREALVSEFLDFRFRRHDELVRWVHPSTVADHREAFVLYLKQHGPVAADIIGTYIAYRQLRQASYYTRTRQMGEYLDLQFEVLMGPEPLPALRAIAQTFGQQLDDATLADLLARAKAADNKTKAVGQAFPIGRQALWTPEAEAEYQRQGFPELSTLLGYAD